MSQFRHPSPIGEALAGHLPPEVVELLEERDRALEDYLSRPHELVFHFPSPAVNDTRGPYYLWVGAKVRGVAISTQSAASANTTTAEVKVDGTTLVSADLASGSTSASDHFDEGAVEGAVITVVLSAVGTDLGDTTVQVLLE